MATNRLNSKELAEYHAIISDQLLPLIQRRREQLIGTPNLKESLELSRLATTLNSHANVLATAKIDEILTDLQEPGKRIKAVTRKLNNAINKLKDLNKFLSILTGIVDFFGKIVGTISGGLPIAAIATTLEGLEKLSAEL